MRQAARDRRGERVTKEMKYVLTFTTITMEANGFDRETKRQIV